jgi:hypothetical protein
MDEHASKDPSEKNFGVFSKIMYENIFNFLKSFLKKFKIFQKISHWDSLRSEETKIL